MGFTLSFEAPCNGFGCLGVLGVVEGNSAMLSSVKGLCDS